MSHFLIDGVLVDITRLGLRDGRLWITATHPGPSIKIRHHQPDIVIFGDDGIKVTSYRGDPDEKKRRIKGAPITWEFPLTLRDGTYDT